SYGRCFATDDGKLIIFWANNSRQTDCADEAPSLVGYSTSFSFLSASTWKYRLSICQKAVRAAPGSTQPAGLPIFADCRRTWGYNERMPIHTDSNRPFSHTVSSSPGIVSATWHSSH